jgi:hypothetical protein
MIMKTTFDVYEKLFGNSGMPTEKAVRDILASLSPPVTVLSIKDDPDGLNIAVEYNAPLTSEDIDTALSNSGYQVSKNNGVIKITIFRQSKGAVAHNHPGVMGKE